MLHRTELAPRAPGDRIDRIAWRDEPWDETRLEGLVDAHALRPGYTHEHWPLLATLLRALLRVEEGSELWRQVEEYVAEFRLALL